jgi:two-component system, chemotaxis family, CheB/CheR fusion protein
MSAIQGDSVGTNGKATDQFAANEELLRLCERKDRFIAVAGHELRNVLAPIVMSLDALDQYSENATQSDLLRIAAQNARQLSRLIDDLFDASRLASGKLQLRRENIDMRNIAEQSIQAVTQKTTQRRQELLVTRCDSPLWLHADPLRLEQVFLNLINNAVKYTPEGGCIWLQLSRQDGAAIFQIRDSGRGIKPDLLPYIFDFFSQADDGNGHYSGGGLGIGLAMAKSLVEMHGGTVEAHSDGDGRGADFTVRLPVHWP